MRHPFLIVLLLASGACARAGGSASPTPDASSPRWRSLLGCYRMGGEELVLDSLPDLKLNADRPGVRQARFAPTPAIVGAYWFVTQRGAVRVVRHDGLWGRTFELTARGDSLVGRGWLRTDVPTQRNPPQPAVAVRSASCRTPPPPA